jgi:hypothetical protein
LAPTIKLRPQAGIQVFFIVPRRLSEKIRRAERRRRRHSVWLHTAVVSHRAYEFLRQLDKVKVAAFSHAVENCDAFIK